VPRLSPRAYRQVTLAALVLLAIIVLTGALVRLTGSGMGCPDWPNCEQGRLVHAANGHQAVEQINRVFTGLVSVTVILSVLGSFVRQPRRRDLTWLSVGLVLGMIGQIVAGGIVVLTHVNPFAVQAHFLLSMAILLDAMVLWWRAGEPDAPPVPPRTSSPGPVPLVSAVPDTIRRWALAVACLFGLALTTGTFVTGTGPHGGDEHAKRFDVGITTVARVHSLTVIVTIGTLLWLIRLARRDAPAWRRLEDALTTLLWVAVAQGVVGYTQYFTGVPVMLVAVHIVGAVTVWLMALRLVLTCRAPAAVVDGAAARRGAVTAAG
jgi:cytochrome c oxidase assembly protein subunit 15